MDKDWQNKQGYDQIQFLWRNIGQVPIFLSEVICINNFKIAQECGLFACIVLVQGSSYPAGIESNQNIVYIIPNKYM